MFSLISRLRVSKWYFLKSCLLCDTRVRFNWFNYREAILGREATSQVVLGLIPLTTSEDLWDKCSL